MSGIFLFYVSCAKYPLAFESITMRYRYVKFYKPYGVLSQFTPDHPGQKTLGDFGLPEGLYAAGRLDADSEGLLLLTNDGPLIHALLQPGTGHERTYLVQVEGIPTAEALDSLERGVSIQDYRTLPAKAAQIPDPGFQDREPPVRFRKAIPTSWIELRLREGKNRQVRRMTATVGFPTLRLVRSAMGVISISGMAPGEWRDLTNSEIASLRTTSRAAAAGALTLVKKKKNDQGPS
jgi:23S rRNA pseudouridine2457 synthase